LNRPHEAAEVAREALPFMRRSGLLQLYVESFVYLFVQRQQPATAARLIGASDAFHARLGPPAPAQRATLDRQSPRQVGR